jgi:hypothetical protein
MDRYICNSSEDVDTMLTRMFEWRTPGYTQQGAYAKYSQFLNEVETSLAHVPSTIDKDAWTARGHAIITTLKASLGVLAATEAWDSARRAAKATMPLKQTEDSKTVDDFLQMGLKQQNGFLYECVSKTEFHSVWVPYHVPTNVDKKVICESVLPQITHALEWIAFSGGVYNLKTDEYYTSLEVKSRAIDLGTIATRLHINRPFYYLAKENATFTSEKPHPLLELDTPCFDTLLQGLDGKTRFWLQAMLGRCLYRPRQLDNWEMTLLLEGPSSSNLIRLIAGIYNDEDVMYITSNTAHRKVVRPLFWTASLLSSSGWTSTYNLVSGRLINFYFFSHCILIMCVLYPATEHGKAHDE